MGGYLIYGGYPQRKVFIDGRAHYPSEFFSEHGSVSTSSAQAKKVMDKYNIDYIIIQHPETNSNSLADHLSDDRQEWALIYWDQYYLVYVRRVPYRCLYAIERESESESTRIISPPGPPLLIGEGESKIKSPLLLGEDKGEVLSNCENWNNVIAKNEYTYGDPVLLSRPEKLQELARQGKDALKPKVRTAGELNRNLELLPDNNRARIMLGGIFELIPDLSEAQKIYEEVAQRDPKFAMGHFLLGNLYMKIAYAKPHEKESESVANTLFLAEGQIVDRGLWEMAKSEFKKSYDLDKSDGQPLVVLGSLAQEERDLDQAINHYTKATLISPTNAEAFYRLGIIYSNERYDREKAKFYLQRFVTLAEGDSAKVQRAKMILDRLSR